MRPQSKIGPHDDLQVLTKKQLAALLGCSERQIPHLVSRDRLPRPVDVERLKRWPSSKIHARVEGGCPNVDQPNT